MRIARFAKTHSGSFPRLARDDVNQWLVEEALTVMLNAQDARDLEKAEYEAAVAAAQERAAKRARGAQ